MGRGKVRKGRGGRMLGNGSRGMVITPARDGRVIHCENCGREGVHRNTSEVRECHGRGVVLGRDFRWVKPY